MNVIICGAGTVGTHAAEVLAGAGHNVTVVESRPDRLADIEDALDVRTLQGNCTYAEVLRQADVRRLALALVGSDAATDNKIKQNMSEGAREALFEESELLARPKQREVEQARELLLTDFRELNEAGMLEFEGE